MSSPYTAKRRKLNHTANVLRKPFVSPLKGPNGNTADFEQHSPPRTDVYRPSTLAHTTSSYATPDSKLEHTKSGSVKPANSTLVQRAVVLPRSSLRGRDPAEQAAQRALTSLELRIRNVRSEIDTLKQAARLNSSSTDSDLEDLIVKWRSTTQSAAEEIFGTVKERICRMGGVQAWKDSEKEKRDKLNAWVAEEEGAEDDDADCEFDEHGEELPEDEVEFRKKEKARVRQEMRDAMEEDTGAFEVEGERKQEVWEEEGRDDDVSMFMVVPGGAVLMVMQTFTMDMMLRSLNIDLDVIGFDKASQRWIS